MKVFGACLMLCALLSVCASVFIIGAFPASDKSAMISGFAGLGASILLGLLGAHLTGED